ncbi:sensor histidine kinase [Microbispora camponoti]|uniref:histidine kinase n=1 Tax=Microbispora bryophytorum subsp. camponoti TaxID=1677852 RepID=A0ABR8LAI9_9ACTN|nr:sensor histidine kinase [Microbispora camponoti]
MRERARARGHGSHDALPAQRHACERSQIGDLLDCLVHAAHQTGAGPAPASRPGLPAEVWPALPPQVGLAVFDQARTASGVGRVRLNGSWQAVARKDLLATSLPWRALAYLVTGAVVGVVVLASLVVSLTAGAFAAALLGVAVLVAAAYPITALATAHALLARLLLTPGKAEPGERLAELTRSRSRLVEAFEVERRRIERDLHDGAQQRLVALTMTLGLAKVSPPAEAAGLVARAHQEAKLALAEIRDLIRGIHPRILADRGLPAAVAELADRSPVPVEVDVDVPRLPEAMESVAYFVVSEGLANVAKHSGAEQARVQGRLDGRPLTVEIRDDGVGGADVTAGTGLAGLADRVSAVEGRLMLSSPPGGPTLLRAEIECLPALP